MAIVADQALKFFIVQNYSVGEVQEIIPRVLSFNYIQNDGAASNIFSGQMWLFYIISAVVIPTVIYLLIKHRQGHWSFKLGLALVLGGIIGNLIDRIRLHYVVDMFQLDFIQFNIFNVADAAISVGVVFIFIYLIFLDKEEK
ncbi:signal peptidase II [Amylolactobacillus amylotrophicus DSM 20534]|uniref:Lipoprotein signal peptidase n=2 Tax=Amylolactobacillus TaxID=2767876 RepID=A0A0R1YKS3_9LACO|nr:signal peptidase II [Amylolactobacillus amylotrophicus DSM 20534]KRM42833.1 signal peptidase II [Amylolactobacillus amylophilus DSM 20533 = JCM 1125]